MNNIEEIEKIVEGVFLHGKNSPNRSSDLTPPEITEADAISKLKALLTPDVDVEGLKKEFMDRFTDEGSFKVYGTYDIIWNFFLPHLKPISARDAVKESDFVKFLRKDISSIRKDAVMGFVEWLKTGTFDLTYFYSSKDTEKQAMLDALLETYLNSDGGLE